MIILIPLGGTGERFKSNGYNLPKALIKVFGKPILYYLLDCLNYTNIDYVYIPYNPEYYNFRFEDTLKKYYPHIHFKFYNLNKNTEGALETINIALNQLNDNDKPILCLDSDNFYTIDIINTWAGDNCVFTTIIDTVHSPIYSYLKVNENNIITDIKEKEKISDYVCTGAYGFNSYKKLLSYTEVILNENIKYKNEYYTSIAIKVMIDSGIQFINKNIDINNWHCLGTPFQLKLFYNNLPCISSLNNKKYIKNMRICFDLDNTLLTFPIIKDDYTSVNPIQKNIDFLKYLKKLGNTIIIYTARRMKTHNGNIGKILYDIGKITFETLEKYDIPFDEIYFGKPEADIYIDDLAVNCFDNLEKELGFYMDTIYPREFNTIEKLSIDTYKKISHNLSSEIFYYKNIPNTIKDLFPLFIDYDEFNKWYIIEKITGVTCTSLYLDELLTENTLIHIMKSLTRIHNINYKDEKINIYGNYSKKLIKRYNNFDYSQFNNYKIVFDRLNHFLMEYETNNKGKISVIHGDPVMTNILINKFGKIKFIDMRGNIDDNNTILGDCFYDWAKLYQSLLGYDSILQDKHVSETYKSTMLNTFKTYFLSKFSEDDLINLKYITSSLIFTLIPLHNNSKCSRFYDLIQKILNNY